MRIVALPFIFLAYNVFAMDIVPVVRSVEPFGSLPQELKRHIFRDLEPKDINSLRKTCYQLSELFSFINPSNTFLSWRNKNMKRNDLQGIALAAVYDKNTERADLLAKIIYSFSFRHSAFAAMSDNYWIHGTGRYLCLFIELDRERKEISHRIDTVSRDSIHPNPLLIACVSRNNCRVEQVIKDPDFVMPDTNEEPFAVYETIDNNDLESLSVMFNCENFLKYIKHYGHELLQRAVYRHRFEAFKFLLNSNYCDVNEKKPDMISEWSSGLREKNNDSLSLLDIINRHDYLIYFKQYSIVLKMLEEKKVVC